MEKIDKNNAIVGKYTKMDSTGHIIAGGDTTQTVINEIIDKINEIIDELNK
jgi:hypothetical protein